MKDHLDRLAERVKGDPFFLGAPLKVYAQSEQMDDQALAKKLGCDVRDLAKLRLCRNPRSEAPVFWRDVKTIAEHFEMDSDQLAEVVRYGQNLLPLPTHDDSATEKESGFFMAARDDDSTDSDNDPPA